MINKLLEIIEPFKKALIILGVLLVLLFVGGVVIPSVNKAAVSKSPIVELKATNDTVYTVNQKINARDFSVTAIHENGKKSEVSSDDVKLSTTSVKQYGKFTEVEVSLKEDESLSCVVKVQNERKKVIGFQCGSPTASDVKAVLYSNGELCFEGKGDVLQFDSGGFPWQKYDGDDEFPVLSVTFEDTVTPTNMDNWFENMDTLKIVPTIPSSVKSMSSTFKNCTSMEESPDWTQCENLLNMNSVCIGCSAMQKIYALPSEVRNAASAFEDCGELQVAPDMSNSNSLSDATSMFAECKKLTEINMPKQVKNMDRMFEDCINLSAMPEIPSTVETMNNTFAGDISLVELTSIPEGVKEISQCFYGCSQIEGSLVINAEPVSFSGAFQDAAVATIVDLTGSCPILDAIANTSDNGNIMVNGQPSDPTIKSYKDLEDKKAMEESSSGENTSGESAGE